MNPHLTAAWALWKTLPRPIKTYAIVGVVVVALLASSLVGGAVFWYQSRAFWAAQKEAADDRAQKDDIIRTKEAQLLVKEEQVRAKDAIIAQSNAQIQEQNRLQDEEFRRYEQEAFDARAMDPDARRADIRAGIDEWRREHPAAKPKRP